MRKSKDFFRGIGFVIVSGGGGFLFSLLGLSIGWMIGSLLTATALSILSPKLVGRDYKQAGIPKYWLYIGQCILGIELGKKINSTVFSIFQENWVTITIMLLLSLILSLLSGICLWKYSKLDMQTSLFATAPGGLSSIPGIAEEAGANTGVVSVVQTMRALLVVLTIPVMVSFWGSNPEEYTHGYAVHREATRFEVEEILMTMLLVLSAWLGYYIGRRLKFPAPWLIGSIVGVAAVKTFISLSIGYDFVAWWPQYLIIASQIFIGASIGSRFHRDMFKEINRTLLLSFFGIIGLIVFTFICAYIVSMVTEITLLTSALAFTPGGITEMTTAALVLNGDFTFVVVVQVLRVVAVCIILPPLFRFLKYWELKKKSHFHLPE
ncbi:MAG TPA: AbrB family transcriptional regulator [Chondromyces sp.]|nr:AbrB family transcriptional regulator [Chondromyces sp.]